jgi:hypothetical protein
MVLGADASFLNPDKLLLLVVLAATCACIVASMIAARAGSVPRIRRIAGLEAVEEAVGRATEMGRPILFVPGIQDMDNPMTVAGITVLSRVAGTAAQYDATLDVPVSRSLVMQAARESVQAAALQAGQPDWYDPERIRYITDEQFGYAAYAAGAMARDKPAACFYMGCFFAESLILAENGNAVGAIQIAGTAETAQLPFFVASCDYTLIGEEFFAASAYLSGAPDQLGTLRGQDIAKALIVVALVLGAGMATVTALVPKQQESAGSGEAAPSAVTPTSAAPQGTEVEVDAP